MFLNRTAELPCVRIVAPHLKIKTLQKNRSFHISADIHLQIPEVNDIALFKQYINKNSETAAQIGLYNRRKISFKSADNPQCAPKSGKSFVGQKARHPPTLTTCEGVVESF